ncbi:MAG: PEGA domain-containing protein [Roseburia sp.]
MAKRWKWMAALAVLAVLGLTACENNKSEIELGQHYYTGEKESSKEAEEDVLQETEEITTNDKTDLEGLYLIVKNDMTSEYMILEQLSTEKQYMYYYSLGTNFKNKYGEHEAVSEFGPGRIVTIGEKNEEGKLSSMQISDKAWEYEKITRYSVDLERKVFKIANTNYAYNDNLVVISGENYISLEELTSLDELRVVGIDKKIYSVTVTTGHGTLALENTSLFEGSYIQIGTKIFAEITPDMQMDLEEGTYTVAVAKDGYGGSTEITIEKGNVTTLNLDELKGEGPKYGNVLFAIPVEGATLTIDGEVVDFSQPIALKYGIHSLTVQVSGYDTWSKYLYVNSAEATIVIDPTESEDEEEETTSESTASESTTSESTSSESSSETSDSEESTDSDYLSTLTELITSLL